MIVRFESDELFVPSFYNKLLSSWSGSKFNKSWLRQFVKHPSLFFVERIERSQISILLKFENAMKINGQLRDSYRNFAV